MTQHGFGSRTVLALTGVTYRQLNYWDKTGLVGASLRRAAGRGSRRVYSFDDLVALRVVAQLLASGLSVRAVRRAVRYLKQHSDRPLSRLLLIADGERVLALTENPDRMIEATDHGQLVHAIGVDPIVRRLKADVSDLRAARETQVRAGGRSYRVVLTPDLEVGGFTVEVPELPGCITEGDSLLEARRMAREAIEGWLEAAAGAAKRAAATPARSARRSR